MSRADRRKCQMLDRIHVNIDPAGCSEFNGAEVRAEPRGNGARRADAVKLETAD